MSSNFERKLLEDLKEQSRRQAQIAAELEPCLTVTEKSWKALIGLQQTQIQFLVDIQTVAARLATRGEVEEISRPEGAGTGELLSGNPIVGAEVPAGDGAHHQAGLLRRWGDGL